MKCRFCGIELSDKVLRIHEPLCKAEEAEEIVINMDNPNMYKEMSMKELRLEAKKLDLDMGQSPKKVELIKVLEDNKWGEA